MGNSTRRFKKPVGLKSIFASRTSPINHADKVAVMAVRYMAGFPFRLKIKNTMSIRNTKNSRIVKINPSIYIPPESGFYPHIGNAAKEILLSSSIFHDPGDLDISLYIEVKRHIVIVKIPAVKGNG